MPPSRLLRATALEVVGRFRSLLPDLSGLTVLLPTLHAASGFARALIEASGGSVLLLPRLTTLAQWAASTPCDRLLWSDSARELAVFAELRSREWFAEADLWHIAGELRGLVDDLTRARARLPPDLDNFVAELSRAYAAGAGAPLQFEARLAYETWRALASGASGPVDAVTRYHLQLGALAASAAGPIIAVGLVGLTRAERDFLDAYGERQAVLEIVCGDTGVRDDPVPALLQSAWPARNGEGAGQPRSDLRSRAIEFAHGHSASPIIERLSLFGAASLEEEAQAADVRVRKWLLESRQRIAIVAQDRLVARRLRALLERAQVLVQDETGWTLSTVAAATVIMRFLDCLGADFQHRDLLDLLKSPFVFSDWTVEARKNAVYVLEQVARRYSVASGLTAFLKLAEEAGDDGRAVEALQRVQSAALRMFPKRRATVGVWLARLREGLGELGIAAGLSADAAGQRLLELIAQRERELGAAGPVVSLGEWRRWLDRQLEGETFRDREVVSPVLFTHLAATRLREFDGVILLGCDARQFPGRGGESLFFNQSVRRELGLPTREDDLEETRRDLISLVASNGEVFVTWQSRVNGEPNLVSPYFALLEAFHQVGYGVSLEDAGWSRHIGGGQVSAEHRDAPTAIAGPAPRPAAPALVPRKVSVSAWGSLVACPYQFFARHMLKLNELDEVREDIERKDYGEVVHEVLRIFHERHPTVTGKDQLDLAQELAETSDHVFQPLLARNYLANGWLLRWKKLIPAYLKWQASHETEGWRYLGGEEKRERAIALEGGGAVTLHGRLDRVDRRGAPGGIEYSVLDYKTQSAATLKKKLKEPGEDVQLTAYALLQGSVREAAFLSLDKDVPHPVPLEGDLDALAAEDEARIARAFSQLDDGAPLPAQGVERTCSWCEMRGLCRREYWLTEGREGVKE